MSNTIDSSRNPACFAAGYRWGLPFYKAGISAFFALGGLWWLKKKYKTGIAERMGVYGLEIPTRALWVHSVSVGEVQSALSLIEAAKQASNDPCVLSTVTTTGRAMAEKLASRYVDAMFYNTWDVPRYVNKALDTLAPKAYVAMETERWPTMLSELQARGIPAFLANGRLSEASLSKLIKMKSFWCGVLCCFDRLMVRFESDKANFMQLGVPEEKIVVTGDCKIDAMLRRKQEADSSVWSHLRRGDAPLFLAGSTHPGEEEIILEAFRTVHSSCPDARLVIAPRHPERALEVVAKALPTGKVDLLSDLSVDGDIIVVDRIGVLFDLYSIADAAFVGGSLVPKGGQNLMEPALFGIQTTHGPDMRDFPDSVRMDAMGAAVAVRDSVELAMLWFESLKPGNKERYRNACASYFETVGGAATRCWKVIEERLNGRGLHDVR